jgi:hypothetical protein
MDERVEGAAKPCFPSRTILDHSPPHREECGCMMINVQEADLAKVFLQDHNQRVNEFICLGNVVDP